MANGSLSEKVNVQFSLGCRSPGVTENKSLAHSRLGKERFLVGAVPTRDISAEWLITVLSYCLFSPIISGSQPIHRDLVNEEMHA